MASPADQTAADSPAPERATPDRIVDAGLDLFSDRGFKGTTVGELERAAGLTPRAGALYRHFPSKEAVLEAAFERHVAEIEALHSAIELMPLGDLRAELTLLARFGLQTLVRERALRRIVTTEGDRFPELKRRYRERVVDRSYEEVAGFIRMKIAAGEFPPGDADAVAAVMTGALLGYTLEYDVFGRHPLGVDEDRLIASLVDAAMALASTAGDGPPAGEPAGESAGEPATDKEKHA
jgi:AcrR family transcriptional regulator